MLTLDGLDLQARDEVSALVAAGSDRLGDLFDDTHDGKRVGAAEEPPLSLED